MGTASKVSQYISRESFFSFQFTSYPILTAMWGLLKIQVTHFSERVLTKI